MKKFILGIVAMVSVLAAALPAGAALAEQSKLEVAAKSSLLMHADSGEVLVEDNADTRHPIASMCKIMTLLLTFESVDAGKVGYDEDIFVSEHAAGMGGSQAFLEQNDSYKLRELIKAVTVASANDGAVAIAEHLAGSEQNFVDRMNERAKSLGMLNTNFVNATGLPKPMQYSCARDVALMTRELVRHEDYFQFSGIWMDKIVHQGGRETGLTNTNKLVRFYNGCDGGKTGFTNEAKHCISATAMRDGTRFIAVVIGADSSKERFDGARALLNYGFGNFETQKVLSDNDLTDKSVSVIGGREKQALLRLREEYSLLVKKGESAPAEIEFLIEDRVKAPLAEGDVVGRVIVRVGGKAVFETDVLAAQSVEKSDWGDHLHNILENW